MAAPDRGPRRDVVTVRGPDALTYLQSQVSQDLRDQAVGERRWTFLLEPNGRVAVLAGITRTEEDTFELDTDAGSGDALLARIDRFKIRVKATTELTPASDVSEQDPDAERARIDAAWPRMGAEIVPGETIPAETGITDVAVSFTKGCYPGQELVERMDSRGASAPRRLRRVEVPSGTQPGDPLLGDDGEPIGTVTSVAGTAALAYVKRSAAP
jgi:folate-binding protein YgfZ